MIRFLINVFIFSVILTIAFLLTALNYLNSIHEDKIIDFHQNSTIIDHDMILHFINLKIGKTTLLQRNKQGILLDVGDEKDSNMLLSYLSDQGVTDITHIILTKPITENIGSLNRVIKYFPHAKVYVPHLSQSQYKLPDTIPLIGLKADERVNVIPLHDVSLEMVEYNYSMAFLLHYEDMEILFTNDMEEEAEAKIIQRYPSLKAEIMTVPDRRSGVTHSQKFIEKIDPQTAIMLETSCVQCDRLIENTAAYFSKQWSDFFFVPKGQSLRIYFHEGTYTTPKNQL